jgi:hypothetical protein
MITLYVGGRKIGTWAEAEKLFVEVARTQSVEFRDENDKVIATSIPGAEPLVPWDPTITQEELDRRAAEPGYTIEEVRKRLGWT